MKCTRCRLLLLFALALLAWGRTPARAGSYTYNSGVSQRTVNAGVLVLSTSELGTGAKDNPDPYVFYVLSKRSDALPYGWSIVNPLAPKNVNSDIKQRWSTLDIAQAVTPDLAAYWEVSLPRATSDDLQQFDVLLLDIKGGPVTLTAADNEKLRRFVDGGGTLWIEGGSGGVLGNPASAPPGQNGLFLGTIGFQAGSASLPIASPATTLAINPTVHAILSAPYFLQTTELDSLAQTAYQFTLTGAASSVLQSALVQSGGDILAAAGSYGAGAIVVTSTYTATVINETSSGTSQNLAQYVGSVQPTGTVAFPMTVALKFLANMIAWGGGHGGERHSSHQDGSAFNAFPSPVRLWNYPVNGNANAPSATIFGSLAFMTDSAGTLHAFDINPAESIANPYISPVVSDDGAPDYSASPGKSYDQVWSAGVGGGASAPTVTVDSGGNAVILVAKADGTIAQFNAKTGAALTALTPTTPVPFVSGTIPPAPQIYNGTVYALQGDGSLYVDNPASGTPATYIPSSGATPATGALAVGIVPVDTTVSGQAPPTNDIVAMLPTTSYLYSIFLGSRGELLRPTASGTGFATKLLGKAAIDASSTIDHVYALNASGFADTTTYTGTSGTPNAASFTLSSAPPTSTNIYADYDTDLNPANSATDLTRTRVGISSRALTTGQGGGTAVTGNMSTPAMDRFGNTCYVTNEGGRSCLISFHDSASTPNLRLNWRFRLPQQTETIVDADGQDYTTGPTGLGGYQFVNEAPAVDERGNVYALATGSGRVAVICINGLQPVTTTPAPNITSNGLTQPLTGSGGASTTDEFGTSSPTAIPNAQFTQVNGSVLTPITINSFGLNIGGGATRSLYPNMSEPASLYSSPGQNNGTNGVPPTEVKLHTNVAWYTVLPAAITPGTGGLTKAGGALFFVDGRGHLISVIADPTSAGIPIVGKYVDSSLAVSSLPSMVTDYGDTEVGIGATPAVGNGTLIVSGPSGFAGYANRVTVVADSSRVMELDSSGDATWVTDSTTGSPSSSALAVAGITTAASLELNHPSSVTELTANDYLVADTGNNRCVRFSRTGQTIWELSRLNDDKDTTSDLVLSTVFNKTGPLLPAGEPDTLNQPTSVQIRTETVTVNSNPYTIVHYLISDTGNYRILEVVDVFDASGNLYGTPHNLVWISHTHDKQQRNYRFQSAAYFPPNAVPTQVIALVTNQRVAVANSATGVLAPANQDTPGASIVVLNLRNPPANPVADGLITFAQSQMRTYGNGLNFDVNAAVLDTTHVNPTYPNFVYLRNPRYLKAYVPQDGSTPYNFLLADDNGVYDLVPTTINTVPVLVAQWGLTQRDYWNINTPLDTSGALFPRGVTPLRPGIPFIPSSIQRTATDQVGNYPVGRYLITNSYSQGEASAAGGGAFGGEVLELSIGVNGGNLASQVTAAHTLGRPSNTSPLVQPAFAYRVP